jgi:hypothetical protein
VQITTAALRAIAEKLLSHVESTGYSAIDIQDDYYWDVRADQRYDPYRKPGELVLGQLCDNWTELQRLLNDEKPLLNYDLVWLAAILRRVGEIAGEAGPPRQP